MERIVAAGGEPPIDCDQVLDPAHLAGEHNVVPRQAELHRPPGACEGRFHHGLAHHLLGVLGLGGAGVLVHQPDDELGVQAAPVDPDSHRSVVAAGDVDQGRELTVPLLASPHVARIDSVLGERLGAFRIVGQEPVAIEMEVTDQGHGAALGVEQGPDGGHRPGRGLGVDGDTHQLGARVRELPDLSDRGLHVRGVGVGHGLDHHGGAAPDPDRADLNGD
jgi:hypothetical protein